MFPVICGCHGYDEGVQNEQNDNTGFFELSKLINSLEIYININPTACTRPILPLHVYTKIILCI